MPKDFRFDATEVRITRQGSAVIIEPIARNWEWLDGVVGSVNADFKSASLEDAGEQRRPALDTFE